LKKCQGKISSKVTKSQSLYERAIASREVVEVVDTRYR